MPRLGYDVFLPHCEKCRGALLESLIGSPIEVTVANSVAIEKPLAGAAVKKLLFILIGLAATYLSHPLTWHIPLPSIWFPSMGIALVFVAWLGPWASLLVPTAVYLIMVQHNLLGWPDPWPVLAGQRAWHWAAVVDGLEVWACWFAFKYLGQGSRKLVDPRSATLFVFLIPGLLVGAFSLIRLSPLLASDPALYGPWVGGAWLGRSLACLALSAPLLHFLTSWLEEQGLADPELPSGLAPPIDSETEGWGDWLELVGLSIGVSILGLLLVLAQWREISATWYLWLLSLSLIAWACLRQGIRGGVLAAGSSSSLCLLAVYFFRPEVSVALPLQYYLLAECCMGILVGASCSWVQGNRFRSREIGDHIPVVLYSCKLLAPDEPQIRADKIHINFVSPASSQLLSAKPEELIGSYEKWIARVHPEDRELLLAAVLQLVRHKERVTFEYRVDLSTADGEPRSEWVAIGRSPDGPPALEVKEPKIAFGWMRDTLVPIKDASDRVVGWEGVVIDITEQRSLADNLRRTMGMFHSLVANLPTGVFFVQAPTGKPILLNARARELLGQREDPTARLGQWSEVYHLHRSDGTPYPEEELPVYQSMRKGTACMRDDIVVHRKDGRKIPLVTWAAPIDLRGRGSPDGAVWVLEDLTALRQAEAAHRESEARLRTVIETMAEGLLVYDRKGCLLECNPAAAEILGRGSEQLRGKLITDPEWRYLREDGGQMPASEHPALVSLRSGQPVRGVVLGIPRTARPVEREAARSDAVGEPRVRWLLVNAMPVMDPRTGLAHRVATTITDITTQKYALEVLRASEERYRELVETMPLMLLQSDRSGKLSYVNPAISEITGYDLQELRGENAWQKLLHPEDLAEMLAASEEAIQGKSARLEVRLISKSKEDKVGYAMFQPYWKGRDVVGATCLIVDVTLQRKLERDLERAQRVELVGRLAGGIAHDFNNLLSVILSLADLTAQAIGTEHPASRDVAGIIDASEQASRLAGQLLTFSKQRKITAKRIHCGEAARRTLDLLRSSLPNQILVELSVCDGEMTVLADETQMQQILMNLCLNARDAMPDGGRLTVQLRESSTGPLNGESKAQDWVCLSVSDTGHGMTDAVLSRVFDPFFSTKATGTGLGLAVVQQIVESYGGQIEVQSKVGLGTSFKVWLPRSVAQEAL